MDKTSIVATVFAVLLMAACQENTAPRTIAHVDIQNFTIDSTSIRAIQVINDSTVWYAGSGGAYGKISNTTVTQHRITDEFDSLGTPYPHFRSIAYNGTAVFALTVADPALVFELNRTPPEIRYREDHSKVFYDSMTFFDAQNGIAFGDPTEHCPSVILTHDGGNSWYKVACKDLPEIEDGEAAFAASNTNIAIIGTKAWLVTGGKKARVFYTPDKGKNWEVYDTPIIQGTPATGMYSVAFHDAYNGIVFGGDYTDKSGNMANKAITTDGGKTWMLVANGKAPGYISCVQYVPDTDGRELFAVSTEGIYFSNDRGHNWTKVSPEGYYSIRLSSKNTAWLSRNNTIAKMTF
ncbi:MAG: oxidoreductase [Bacteroidota bacterium]